MYSKRKLYSRKSSKKYARGESYKARKSYVPRTVTKFGDQVIHRFRRYLPDITFYGAGGGAMSYSNVDGLAVNFLTMGGTLTEVASSTGLVMFPIAIDVRLNSIISPTEITDLFQQYRIRKAVVRLSMDSANTWTVPAAGAPQTVPSVYIAADPNDATTPSTAATLLKFSDVKIAELRDDRVCYFAWYPKPSIGLFAGVVSTGYGAPNSNKDLWLDTSSPSADIPHYALKAMFRNVNPNTPGLCIRMNTYIEFDVRTTR